MCLSVFMCLCVCDIEIFEFFRRMSRISCKKEKFRRKKEKEFKMKITQELFRICLFVFLFAGMERIYFD